MSELPIYVSPSRLDELSLLRVPHHDLTHDIFSESLPAPVSFALALDSEWLWFSVRVLSAPRFNSAPRCGEYIEGLWNADVGEFFLLDDSGPGYQEFNLSPGGAWWSMYFPEYRRRDPAHFKNAEVRCFSRLERDSWSAALCVRRNTLSVTFEAGPESRANVCLCLGDRYVSFTQFISEKPDFHLIEQFVKVQRVPLAL